MEQQGTTNKTLSRKEELNLFLGDQEQLFQSIADNSIDAIITDPPYGLKWKHKIETHFDFKTFINNSFRVLKPNGFLVYFGQEPSISLWNSLAQQKFHYLAEIIWYKRGNSSPFHFPLRVHEKIMLFTKGKGKLNPAKIEWEWEKEEIIDHVNKATILRAISSIKKMVKEHKTIEDLQIAISKLGYLKDNTPSKVNDNIYKALKYKVDKNAYIFMQKKLTTLWGCRPHNHQGYGKEEFNIKHPTVKPLQIMERLLEMTTQEGNLVLDPFMGSGTTGITCISNNRKFIGFELIPEYYDIAEQRIKEVNTK